MIDRYTKVVLTVIAVGVSINALHTLNLIGSANAGGHVMPRVVICDPHMPDDCAGVVDGTLATSG